MGRAARGFTLYELLFTLTLIAALAALAVGSFAGVVARHRVTTEVNALFHAVHLARKESIVRRETVSLCPSPDGLDCRPGLDWSDGWILFHNRDRDEPPRVDAGEPVLAVHDPGGRVRIVANRRGFTLRGAFRRATNGTIVVCDNAGRVPARALVVSYTGRPRVTGRTPRGEPYACAD